MPQMAPINWLSLFFMFCLTFIMYNLLNYFSFYTKKISNPNIKNPQIYNNYNWKW